MSRPDPARPDTPLGMFTIGAYEQPGALTVTCEDCRHDVGYVENGATLRAVMEVIADHYERAHR